MNIIIEHRGGRANGPAAETTPANRPGGSVARRTEAGAVRRLLVSLLALATASIAMTSVAAEQASAAVLQTPSIQCNPYHGQVVVHSGVLVSQAAGDGAYSILLYRWTSTGWKMIAATTDYAPASFSVTTTRTFSVSRGVYGAYVKQVSGAYTSQWLWTGWCSMG